MYKSLKTSWDVIFIFMIFVSISLFGIDYYLHIHPMFFTIAERIDIFILLGYYLFFAYDLGTSKHKIRYCKQHWMLILLLALPFLPLGRLLRLRAGEEFLKITQDTIWHVLDELEML